MAGHENVHVDPQQVSAYGMHMLLYAVQATMPLATHLANVERDSSGAFAGLDAINAGVFAEGAVMQAAMAKQSYAFKAFASDLARGLTAIGNAADVCAYAYHDTDAAAAEKLNLLGYAFATDPGAPAPKGLPHGTGKTMLDQELSGDGGGGGLPEAVLASGGGTTVQVYGQGQLTYYDDGSTRMVQTQTVPGDPSATREITTLTGPGGQVLSTTTIGTRYTAAGTSSEYYRQVVTPDTVTMADGVTKSGGVTVTTRTSGAPDGGKTIETTTQTGDAKPTNSTVHAAPAPATRDVTTTGPLEQAQEVLGPDAGTVDWHKGYQN